MRAKKVITWKDADQNLCTLAASILSNSMDALRRGEAGTFDWPLEGGGTASPGMGQEIGSRRSIWSCDEAIVIDPRARIEDNRILEASPQCWWSFQNMIRMRLAQARQDLKDNRYLRNNPPKSSKQDSRNPDGRPPRGKYGRKRERE